MWTIEDWSGGNKPNFVLGILDENDVQVAAITVMRNPLSEQNWNERIAQARANAELIVAAIAAYKPART